MKKVLSTKTLDSETLAFAQQLALDVECVDFIETTAFPFKPELLHDKVFDALVFTSPAAVNYFFANGGLPGLITGKQVFALQGKTRDELAALGIEVALTAPSAHHLALAIINNHAARAVLHVCGNLRLTVLEEHLRAAGIAYTDLMVYQTGLKFRKIDTAALDAVLFYSPSGIESFFKLNSIHSSTVCCCIGSTTSNELAVYKSDAIIITPQHPTPQAMLSTVADYFNGHIKIQRSSNIITNHKK